MAVLCCNTSHYFVSLQRWVEPYFEYAGHSNLSFESECSLISQIDYQSNLIAANRKNITAHVRKITLLREKNAESERIFAAHVDFFGSLEEKGFAIKKRLLLTCRSMLEEDQVNYLVSSLNGCVILEHTLLESVQAWQLFAHTKPRLLIKLDLNQQQNANSNNIDLKQTVSDYLENSQTELAIELLENALTQNPQMIEMGGLLMQLYKGTDNKTRFTQLVNGLDRDKHNSLPSFWTETSDYFNKQGSAQ